MTSPDFAGLAARNPQAPRGYSRDHRRDGKQGCIALVVSQEGLPLGDEVFAGNRSAVKTLEAIMELSERRSAMADRIGVRDRGMVSEANRA
jgi:transposase